MTTITMAQYPFFYTNDNQRLHIDEFGNDPRVGDTIDKVGDKWYSVGSTTDESCVNGVCSLPMPDNRG